MNDFETHHNVLATIADGGAEDIRGGLYDHELKMIDRALHRRSGSHFRHLDAVTMPELTSAIEVKDRAIYGGVCFDHFGHFLTESIGRLWIATQPEFIDDPIYMYPLFGHPDFLKQAHFINQILCLLGVDPTRLKFILQPTSFDSIVIPDQLYGFHTLGNINARFMEFILGAQRRLEERRNPSLAKQIYVSRAKWTVDRGLMSGEKEFEKYLIKEGWTMFYPEDHSFLDQMMHYENAESIIFAEGSAYHSLVLAPKIRAKIAVVMRRSEGQNPTLRELMCGLEIDYIELQHVKKTISLGLYPHNAVSIIDYYALSCDLVDRGMTANPFLEWPSLEDAAVDEALQCFLEFFKSDKRLLAFLRSLN